MMNHPKLLPSQELVLHQVSVDSFSPATPSVLKFPTSPLLSRSPFAAASASPTVASPSVSASLSGPTATAAASIVRPQIRLREEWAASLNAVDAFELSAHALHTSSFDRTAPVRVRYIADRYDTAWLSRRPVLAVRGEDGSVSVVRGKTGGVGTGVPVASDLSTAALEDVFTALELAAHDHPEVPLERLLAYARPALDPCTLSDETLEELHAYWLLRRNGNGGLLSTIPSLRTTVREDNEVTLCHPAVLRDCPLPFKQRDWYVPVIERRRPGGALNTSASAKRCRSSSPSAEEAQMDACAASVEKAARLSRAMLAREEARLTHTLLTVYELACLRRVADGESTTSDTVETAATQHALSHFFAAASSSQEETNDARLPI